jgi:hypothetical protein
MADSKVIWSLTAPQTENSYICQYGFQGISPDGETAVCGAVTLVQGTQRKPVAWRVAWLAWSVRGGAARTLGQVIVRAAPTPSVYALWVGTSGDTIIGEWSRETSSGPQQNPPVGVISHGRFRDVPSPPDAGAFAPSVTW